MPDSGNVAKGLRDRLGSSSEDRLGKALSDLLESPLLAGAVGRAFDAREKATQAQEVAFGALNLPSAADIERLTRRLRSVAHRLEGIEDGVDRLDRALSPSGIESRLSAIEAQLRTLTDRIDEELGGTATRRTAAAAATPKGAGAPAQGPPARSGAAKPARRTGSARTGKAAKRAGASGAEQAKRTAAAKAAKQAKSAQGARRSGPG
jgi:hypothetical protein